MSHGIYKRITVADLDLQMQKVKCMDRGHIYTNVYNVIANSMQTHPTQSSYKPLQLSEL